MAAEGYIQIDGSTQQGGKVLRIHNLIQELLALTDDVGEALAQAAADDGTNVKLMTVLGTTTADNANAVSALVGSVRINVHDAGNAFLQFASRINSNH